MSTTLVERSHATQIDAGIPFHRLLRVEWGKATDTRAARWLIAITGAATVLVMLAPLLAKSHIDQTQSNYLQFSEFALATLLPIVSILTMTTEWTQRTVLTTFTQEPRRLRVLWAKIVVSVLMALAGTAFGAVVTVAYVGLAAAGGRHISANLDAALTGGFPLFLLLNIMMGVAFGALLMNTPAAIVVILVVPVIFGFIGNASHTVTKWFDPGTTFGYVSDGHWDGHVGGIVVSTLIWVIAPLVAGLIRTTRREIS